MVAFNTSSSKLQAKKKHNFKNKIPSSKQIYDRLFSFFQEKKVNCHLLATGHKRFGNRILI